jgi:hypothetical protein
MNLIQMSLYMVKGTLDLSKRQHHGHLLALCALVEAVVFTRE